MAYCLLIGRLDPADFQNTAQFTLAEKLFEQILFFFQGEILAADVLPDLFVLGLYPLLLGRGIATCALNLDANQWQ